MGKIYTPLQRVMTTLQHKEPDRVPFFLFFTMHGALEIGISIEEYFSKAEYVAEAQIKLQKKYGHDCVNGFYYIAAEFEAFAGDIIFSKEGPINAGAPIIHSSKDILSLKVPKVEEIPVLNRILKTIEVLNEKVGEELPVIGLVTSPLSLPIMQMGFDKYIELMVNEPEVFEVLLQKNKEFTISWANAQINAGATAIAYFDPGASITIMTKENYIQYGSPVAKEVISKIKGPTITHMAAGRCLSILDCISQTGTLGIATSSFEDLATMKKLCEKKLTILGNLNGIEMCNWNKEQAEESVKSAIEKAALGGGYILADNHGEIPMQVSEEVLFAISSAVRKWGQYPLKWVNKGEE